MSVYREFVTADHHFGHHNIIKYCSRPENHEDLMIDGWNNVVKPNDLVYHLGDFALTKFDNVKTIIELLPGCKHLLLGNHDRHGTQWYRNAGFDFAQKSSLTLIRKNITIVLSHRPIEKELLHKERQPNTLKVINIHGHTHNNSGGMYNSNGVHVNVSVEVTDYRPVLLDDILNQVKHI